MSSVANKFYRIVDAYGIEQAAVWIAYRGGAA